MPDLLNGLFELFGGCLIWLSVKKVYAEKKVAGVSLVPISFFTCWGFFNLYFYPSQNLFWSFAGGCLVVLANCVWLYGLWRYSDKQAEKRRQKAFDAEWDKQFGKDPWTRKSKNIREYLLEIGRKRKEKLAREADAKIIRGRFPDER